MKIENFGRDVTHYTFENKQYVIGASDELKVENWKFCRDVTHYTIESKQYVIGASHELKIENWKLMMNDKLRVMSYGHWACRSAHGSRLETENES